MSRLVWDQIRSRTYEVGVDRGVLYLEDEPGVAWNGLTQIVETLPDRDVSSKHIDGKKFQTVITQSAYQATISAYSAPTEFDACEGLLELYPGFYATNQIRGSFGLSYRTLIGDVFSGTDYGYKIHIVYNLMAFRASKQQRTIQKDLSPEIRQWNCFARPYLRDEQTHFRPKGLTREEGVEKQYFLHRPGAHYVISSLSVEPQLLAQLEDILYGNDEIEPSLPTPTMLIDLVR